MKMTSERRTNENVKEDDHDNNRFTRSEVDYIVYVMLLE